MTSRGKNFTEKERCRLMELVQKYKNIIENKSTNAISTLKKNEAWEAISTEFNSTAEVPRTQKQLCTAYLNMKRVTRQNIANENIKKYLEHSPNTLLVDEPKIHTEVVETHNLLKQLKKDEVADKKGVMATGGGVHTPVLSSVGARMLAIMGDQVKPLSNNCDSASSYFLNDENVTTCDVLQLDDIQQPSCSQNYTITVPQPSSSQDFNQILPIPKTIKHKNKRKVPQKIKQLPRNTDMLKKEYYKKKLECVNIEKKTKLLDYKISLKKHKLLDLEIRIKQNEYDSLKM